MRTLAKVASISAMLLLAGCLLNSAHRIDRPIHHPPRGQAVIVFGVVADYSGFDASQPIYLKLDRFSLEAPMGITGDCFRYTRLEAEVLVSRGGVSYVAFIAPAGHYVLSPFLALHRDASMMYAFHAPAGRSTYFGDLTLVGEPLADHGQRTVERRGSADAAQAFADHLRLGPLAPADTTPIDGTGPIFVCTP